MYTFLIPLAFGFASNLASAFTTTFSRRFGQKPGSIITTILRNLLGIPIWTIGLGLAMLTPSPLLITPKSVMGVIGWLLIAMGAAIIIPALLAIRWRAVIPSTQDTLVQNGLYAYIRHPIHAGTLLEFIGMFLLKPTQTFTLACVLGILWIFIQSRLEEFDLLQRIPDYGEYMKRVPAFLPHLRPDKPA